MGKGTIDDKEGEVVTSIPDTTPSSPESHRGTLLVTFFSFFQ